MLTTFNKELYEQGLKEEGAREADERIADLEQQNENLQNQLLMKDRDSAMIFFQNGTNYEIVRASIQSLTDEELQSLYKKVTGKSYLD